MVEAIQPPPPVRTNLSSLLLSTRSHYLALLLSVLPYIMAKNGGQAFRRNAWPFRAISLAEWGALPC